MGFVYLNIGLPKEKGIYFTKQIKLEHSYSDWIQGKKTNQAENAQPLHTHTRTTAHTIQALNLFVFYFTVIKNKTKTIIYNHGFTSSS